MALGALVGQKPQIDLSQYVMETELNSKGYATQSWVTGQNYVTQSWVNGRGYATQTWVGQQGYAIQSWVNSQGFAKTSQIPDVPANFGKIINLGTVSDNGITVTVDANGHYLLCVLNAVVPTVLFCPTNIPISRNFGCTIDMFTNYGSGTYIPTIKHNGGGNINISFGFSSSAYLFRIR